jgi:hypothetical protein
MIFAGFVGIAFTLLVELSYNGKKMSHLLKMNPTAFSLTMQAYDSDAMT